MSGKILELWECLVIDIGTDSFYARLFALLKEEPEMEAEIPFATIPMEKSSIILGKIFYWVVTTDGTKTYPSFALKEPKPYTKEELEYASAEAHKIRKGLGLED